ncbi:hypothetical protein [Brevundimonas sp. UBA7534]|uniref:hypothetical protein n=1 Tax=Brevundimonas sp. UBA7534 TaxID=1946138 RepID=UPI0025C38C19|nr:hypothetical protein [Brevundimonas sp. UBA7534]
MENTRPYARRPAALWSQARRAFQAGMSVADVAAAYGLTVSAVRGRIGREGWSRDRPAPDAAGPDGAPDAGSPDPGSPDAVSDAAFPVEPDADPADLARAATQASGRAMRDGDWSRAHALAGLAERYRKLAGRDDARRNALTPDTAPLQLVVDILMDDDLPNRRLARDPDKDPDPVAIPYHRRRQRLSRLNEEFHHAQVSRRCACDRRIDALEAHLTAAGLTPVEEDDRARRIRLGQDMHLASGKVVPTEDWERSLDDDG